MTDDMVKMYIVTGYVEARVRLKTLNKIDSSILLLRILGFANAGMSSHRFCDVSRLKPNATLEANFFLLTVFRLKASLVDETGALKIHLMKYKSPLLVAFVRDGALGFLM